MTSIPAFHVSDKSKVKGDGEVYIKSRDDAATSGSFKIKISASFDPAVNDYPTGTVVISTSMSDSFNAVFESTSIELINSYGKHNPTVYLTGRCKTSASGAAKGLRYWVMIANNCQNNDGTPDIVGFVIHDNNGSRVSYGTGPLKGNIVVAPK